MEPWNVRSKALKLRRLCPGENLEIRWCHWEKLRYLANCANLDNQISCSLTNGSRCALHLLKEPLVTNERRHQLSFGVTTLASLNQRCGLRLIVTRTVRSRVDDLWKTLRSIGITGKSSGT